MKKIIYRILWCIVWAVFKVVFPFRSVGRENLPKDEGIVMCLNHISMLDPFFVLLTCPRHVRFVGKAELFRNRLLAAILHLCGAFPIERGTADMCAIDTAGQIVSDGGILGIFVEGTRTKSPTGEPGRPKSGAALIREQTGGAFLPTAVVYSAGRPRPFRRVTVRYGEVYRPQPLTEQSKRTALRAVTSDMFEKIVSLWRQGI